MKYYYIEEKEWISSEEILNRLDKGFDFKCNECHKSIGSHMKVFADGIFCPSCFTKIMEDLQTN